MSNVLIWKDPGPNVGPAELVLRVNGMCGSLVNNPRPDMRGDFVVVDIVAAQIVPTGQGWGVTAIISVEPDRSTLPPITTAAEALSDDGDQAEIEKLLGRGQPIRPEEVLR